MSETESVGALRPMVDPYKAKTMGRPLVDAWISYNETMFQLVRRHGAPAILEMAETWLATMGRWASVDDQAARP